MSKSTRNKDRRTLTKKMYSRENDREIKKGDFFSWAADEVKQLLNVTIGFRKETVTEVTCPFDHSVLEMFSFRPSTTRPELVEECR